MSFTKVLITGEMRSGTTFLANFLNSQHGMVVYADMLVSLFMEAHSLGIQDIHKELSEREKNVLMSNLLQEGKLHHLDFSTISREEELTWFELFEKALRVVKGEQKASIVGVKRTREEEYLYSLLQSGVKVIYCVRDPRDVVISARNRFAMFDLFKSADNWQKSVKLARKLEKNKNFMLLRYEDLILRKDESAKALATFLGLPVTTQLDQLSFGRDKQYRDNSSFGDVDKLFDPKAVNRWKADTGNPEVLFCEELLASEMQHLAYERKTGSGRKTEAQRLIKAYHKQKRREGIAGQLKKIYKAWFR